mgnify:CR=1 FL=1
MLLQRGQSAPSPASAMFGMRALALFALLASMPEVRSVPTRFLEGELGMPAVRHDANPTRRRGLHSCISIF